jgi:hypothetical protein
MTRLRERLDEVRNIKGEVGKVKKMIKKFAYDTSKARGLLYANIEKTAESVGKTNDADMMLEFENEMKSMLKFVTADPHMNEMRKEIIQEIYTIFWKKDR